MGYHIFEFQLQDHASGESIIAAGGTVIVTAHGSQAKATLYDPDDDFASLSNPVSLTRGKMSIATDDTVDAIDVFGFSGDGHAIVLWNLERGGHDVAIDRGNNRQLAVIPYAFADAGADTEYDTGLDEPDGIIWDGLASINVKTESSGDTIDVGTDGSSDDADGFIDGASVATAGFVVGATSQYLATTGYRLSTGLDITYTLLGTPTVGAGYIHLPYRVLPDRSAE